MQPRLSLGGLTWTLVCTVAEQRQHAHPNSMVPRAIKTAIKPWPCETRCLASAAIDIIHAPHAERGEVQLVVTRVNRPGPSVIEGWRKPAEDERRTSGGCEQVSFSL